MPVFLILVECAMLSREASASAERAADSGTIMRALAPNALLTDLQKLWLLKLN